MATLTSSPLTVSTPRKTVAAARPKGEALHQVLLWFGILLAAGLILYLAILGARYYPLSLEDRPLSPLHSRLRSSGTIGLRLGFLSLGMFAILFLYPLRKHWKWLSGKGSTRRWLNFHILFGIATPLVVTFHTSFRYHGVAGLAYWTMMVVALSGFVGRYVYAKIPRHLSTVKLTMDELESQTSDLANRLHCQNYFQPGDLAPLLDVPGADEIRKMSLLGTLWLMICKDLARPFQVSRLRRHSLSGFQKITTLGGFLMSHHRDLELIVSNVRRLSRQRVAIAFLDRTERVFHLWHVVHRPFSVSFVGLLILHIGVVVSVGL